MNPFGFEMCLPWCLRGRCMFRWWFKSGRDWQDRCDYLILEVSCWQHVRQKRHAEQPCPKGPITLVEVVHLAIVLESKNILDVPLGTRVSRCFGFWAMRILFCMSSIACATLCRFLEVPFLHTSQSIPSVCLTNIWSNYSNLTRPQPKM